MVASTLPITGMACRFPGPCASPRAYWDFLMAGKSAIVDVPPQRWDHRLYTGDLPQESGRTRVRRGGFIHGPLDGFDGAFFGLSGPEVETLDPQLQLLLEVTAEAIENAGLRAEDLRGGSTGVFVGTLGLDHEINSLRGNNYRRFSTHTAIGMTASMRANRVSHTFDFRGPSMAIETACSSSLVALHLAHHAILRGECDRAVIGAVNLMLGPEFFLALSKGKFLSEDSECFTFDSRANGYVRGEGAAAIVLEASCGRDRRVHGFLRATAVNHNGGNDGITVPSVDAQSRLTATLLAEAGMPPSGVDYVEAHGTGTAIGDVIEAKALGTSLGAVDGRGAPLVVGAVKGNIGHLEAVAGLAGLIKTLTVLQTGLAPPNRNFKRGNPNIDFERLNLDTRNSVRDLPRGENRFGLVSAYGFGGANAQCLVSTGQSAETSKRGAAQASRSRLLAFSAANPEALKVSAASIHTALDNVAPEVLAGATARYRASQPFKVGIVGHGPEILQDALQSLVEGRGHPALVQDIAQKRPTVFLYSGMGTQYYGVGRELLQSSDIFRAAMQDCDDILRADCGLELLPVMSCAHQQDITDPIIAQPLCVALQIGLTRWWQAHGVQPDAVIGHSSGEMTAGWLAGLFSMADTLTYAAERGRIFSKIEGRGGMTAVGTSSELLEDLLRKLDVPLDIAAINGAEMTSVSGQLDALTLAERYLAESDIWFRRLPVGVAYHSRELQPFEAEFRAALPGARRSDALVPMFSTTTGERVEDGDFDSDYWWQNVRQKVLFGPAVRSAVRNGYTAYLELSGHPALIQHLSSWDDGSGKLRSSGSLSRKETDSLSLDLAAARLFTAGALDDLKEFCRPASSDVLPAYPWRCRAASAGAESQAAELLGRKVTESAGTLWNVDLSSGTHPGLRDHIVGGIPTIPGVFLLRLACEAARKTGRDLALKNISFSEAVALSPTPELELRVQSGGVEIWARDPAYLDGWSKRATASFSTLVGRRPDALDLDKIAGNCATDIAAAEFYDRLSSLGLAYGPEFQAVSSVHTTKGEALARIKAGHELSATLDAALQALAALSPCDGIARLLPTGIASFKLWELPGTECAAWARLRYSGHAGMLGDVTLCDPHGHILAEFCGVELRPRSHVSPHDTRFLQVMFQPWRTSQLQVSQVPRKWWIIPEARNRDVRGAAEHLGDALQDRGLRVIVAPRTTANNLPSVDPLDAASVAAEVDRALYAGADALMVLWGCSPPVSVSAQEGDACIGLPVVAGVMHLLQSVARLSEGRFKRIVFLTLSNPGTDPEMLMRGSMSGFLRVAANEHPELGIVHVDTDDPLHADLLRALPDLPPNPDCHYRFRDGAFFVPRIMEPAIAPVLETLTARDGVHGLCQKHPKRIALRQVSTEMNNLGPDQVEIGIDAFSLGFKDVLKARGTLRPSYLAQSYLKDNLGGEYSGRVLQVGRRVHSVSPGDLVVFSTASGFVSRMRVSERELVRLPKSWRPEQGAFLGRYITAFYALHDCARIEAGDKVFIQSAASGLGLAALHLARHFRADVFASTSSPPKHAYLTSLGIRTIVSSRSAEWSKDILRTNPDQKFDIMIGAFDDKRRAEAFGLLEVGGRLIETGHHTSSSDAGLTVPVGGNQSLISVDLDWLRAANSFRFRHLVARTLKTIEAASDIPPLGPIQTFPTTKEGITEALDTLSNGLHFGGIAITASGRPEKLLQAPLDCPASHEGSYLISGGTSGLGLEIADLLSEQGAGRVILLSRSGQTSCEDECKLVKMRDRGTDVEIFAVDITQAEDVRKLLADLAASPKPLRGIVQAAAVYDDELIYRFNRSRLRSVLQPKLLGAWHLHTYSQDVPLDFFVLMGSASLYLGNPGQSAYAAANAGLAAIADLRQIRGLPAQILHWGVVGKTGIGARDRSILTALEARGVYPLSLQTFKGQFLWHLRNRTPEIAVGAIDWIKWVGALGANCPSGPYQEVVPALDTIRQANIARSNDMLAALSQEEKHGHIADILRSIAAELLGIDAVSLDLGRPLGSYGMDSLLAVQFFDRIQLKSGLEPGPPNRIPSSSLVELATGVLGHISRQHVTQNATEENSNGNVNELEGKSEHDRVG